MSIYNLMGWLALLGIVVGASNVFEKTPSPSPPQSFLPSPINSPSSSRYHKITVALTSLGDLKIKVGDLLKSGTIISDRPQEKQEIAAKQQQIEAKILQVSLPILPIPPLVSQDFASEEIALRQAKLKLEQITQKLNAGSQLQFKQIELSEVFESEKIKQFNQLQEQQRNASLEIEAAIARLNEAKNRSSHQQYEHKLRLAEYQTRLQRQQTELSALKNQLESIKQGQDAVVVRSPYHGKVHRIKVLGQQDQKITVEIILSVR